MLAKQFGTIFSIALLIGGVALLGYALVKDDTAEVMFAFTVSADLPDGVDDVYLSIPIITLTDAEGTPTTLTLPPQPLSLRTLREDTGRLLSRSVLPQKEYRSLTLSVESISLSMAGGGAFRAIMPATELVIPFEKSLKSKSTLYTVAFEPSESFFLSETGAWIVLPVIRVESTGDATVTGDVGEPYTIVKGQVVESEVYRSDTEGVLSQTFEIPEGFILSVENGTIVLTPKPVEAAAEPLPSLFTPEPILDGAPHPI